MRKPLLFREIVDLPPNAQDNELCKADHYLARQLGHTIAGTLGKTVKRDFHELRVLEIYVMDVDMFWEAVSIKAEEIAMRDKNAKTNTRTG